MTKIVWMLLTCVALTDAYRILVVFPFPGKSHGILGDGFVRHFLAAGHEVTYITPFPKEKPRPNLREVDVSSNKVILPPSLLNVQGLMDNKVDFTNKDLIFRLMFNITSTTLQNDYVQKLIEDTNQQFDVVVVEWMFSEASCGFAAVFNCPCIMFFPFENPKDILALIDEPPNPAYTPVYSLRLKPPFSFSQRILSLWSHLKDYYTWISKRSDQSVFYESAFKSALTKRGRPLPSLEEMNNNISLALVNSHVSLGLSLRVPYNYINIGGYHIDTNVKPLPENLKKIMDNAKNGVIYFSLGSNLQSKDLPYDVKKGLLYVFRGLKQTVLWKFEEDFPDLPKNVHILNWAPQPSILAHPNCILFITHGGLLSTTETVHFGVPIIGIPVFADQFLNVDEAVHRGFAKRVDLSYTMADDLKLAIDDILTNPRYTQRAKELSMIYHDRVVPPGTEMLHWVGHVVRTRGARHLRSPASSLPLYQKWYLDFAGLVIVALTLLLAIIKLLISTCFSSNNADLRKKTN
ncbi:UDP-glucosyltransferase 2-like [Pectinophora gossypiella]|uniref:UDP-glucosyltransferase 2-like n=1 Tax=Pectinophora gossypiella TaxID=13191 RepID=UPI00214F3997|nr:UDP-glucosyltransferase 2-like [Pectinophora gossypiella]